MLAIPVWGRRTVSDALWNGLRMTFFPATLPSRMLCLSICLIQQPPAMMRVEAP